MANKNKPNIKNGAKGVGNASKKLLSAGSWLLIGLIIFSLLTGVINQRKTGETLVQYYVNASHKLGNLFNENFGSILQNMGLTATEDGIYLEENNISEDSFIENPGAEAGAQEVNITPIIE